LENKKFNKWNLHSYVIELLSDGSYSWTAFTHWDDGDDPFMGITVSKGKCTIDSGKDCILLMHDNVEDSLYEGEDPDKILAAFPVWDKTKYWINDNGFGGRNVLRDTKTNDESLNPAVFKANSKLDESLNTPVEEPEDIFPPF
jgi:hypothetical protein